MKNCAFFLLLACWSSLSAANESEKYEVRLDWDNSSTLQDTVVQTCDDTYYSSIDIIVPGRAGKDFTVDMDVDITSGKSSAGCTVTRKVSINSVTYSFEAISSCTIKVYQRNPRAGEQAKTATFELHDAC